MTVWDPDGPGPLEARLVIGGSVVTLSMPGLAAAPSVAVWDGFRWQPILTGNTVKALTTFEGRLVAGGTLRRADTGAADGVAAFDGTTWQQLGDNLVGNVESLIVYNNRLVALGRVRRAGQTVYEAAVVLENGTWRSLGTALPVPGSSERARVAMIFQGDLYVGGFNLAPAGSPMQYLTRWDGTTWQPVGGGANGSVFALTTMGNQLIAGGGFTAVGPSDHSVAANSVAAWDGQAWTSLNSPLLPLAGNTVPVVSALAVQNERLFVGGLLRLNGIEGVAAFDGSAWSPVAGGVTGTGAISVLMPWQAGMLVGGWFARAGGLLNECAAYFDGERWLPFNDASVITDIGTLNGTTYATGLFIDRPSWNTFTLARRVGDRWSPVPASPQLRFLSYDNLASFQGRLIVIGQLSEGISENVIFAYDGTTWTQIGSPDDAVFAAIEWNNELCVAGRFQDMSGVPANRISAWNGTTWRAVPGAPNLDVYELAANNGILYAGGGFTRIGNRAASRIAQFDGTQWLPLGTGVAGEVYAIAPWGSDVIIGGSFVQAGGLTANNVVRWSNGQFVAMGTGANSAVNSLATQGNRVFAGGLFTSVSGVPAYKVAIWDGAWRESNGVSDNLGGGVVTRVRNLADQVHVVGSFWRTAVQSANLWARWSDGPFAPSVTFATSSVRQDPGTTVLLELAVDSLSQLTITWRRNGLPIQDGPGGSSVGGGTVSGIGTLQLSISGLRLSDAGSYDAMLSNVCGATQSPTISVSVICPVASFDGNDDLTPSDVFVFLAAWFANDPRADFNRSGSITVQDVFSFLAAWFAGC